MQVMMHMLFYVVLWLKEELRASQPCEWCHEKGHQNQNAMFLYTTSEHIGLNALCGQLFISFIYFYLISLCLQQVNEVNVDSLSLQLDLYFRISAGPSLVAQLLQRPASSAHMCRNASKTKQNLQKQLQ